MPDGDSLLVPTRHFFFLLPLLSPLGSLWDSACWNENRSGLILCSAGLASSHLPLLDPSRFAGETDADFEEFAGVGGKGLGIAFVLDLL